MVSGPYDEFTELGIDKPETGVVRITMRAPALNAVSAKGHKELADVWRVIDDDRTARAVVLRGEGGVFSAGGSFDLLNEIISDERSRTQVLRESRDLVFNILHCSKPIVSAIEGPAVGAGLVAGLLADVSVAGRTARLIDGHTRLGVAAGDHAAICWPLLCGMAKAKYYLLTGADLRGEEAERIGLVSLCVNDGRAEEKATQIAVQLAGGAAAALGWTKLSLNHWYLSKAAVFDASLAYEFYGFGCEDASEGLTALREKRSPRFAS